MKVYICGNKNNSPEFDRIETLLREKGHVPINPIKVLLALPKELSNSDFTVIAFELIRVCDAIYLLENWKTDLFARLEAAHAKRLERELLSSI